MKVVFTAAAQNDLREIGEWLARHYPVVATHVERRIRDIVARVGRWPESAPRSAAREGVPGHASGPVSLQDFLSRSRRCGRDVAHSPRGARAVG